MSEATIFAAALEKPTDTERSAFLAEACGDDEKLRRRVEALLRAHAESDELLDPRPGNPTTADEAAIEERPGSRIGPYRLMEQIGEGGFGLVFVAEQQEPVRRKVALKVIKPGMDSKQVIARFEAERQALALMDHPNIARVFDAGATDSGRPYFVMELVRGIPITDYCDQNQLTPRERLELFVTVCNAIQHAHQKGIIHRDVKPSNVLVTSHDGKPVAKVIDFGVAKAIHQHLTERTIYTQFAQMIGTPLYMSPEQAEMSGLDIDTRSDIYSLGVLLYELLTGSTPLQKQRFAKAAYDEIRRLIREEEPPRPSQRLSTSDTLPSLAASRKTEPARLSKMMRGELDWIAMKALEKDRTRRYETANGLARDVQRYLADEPVEACPPSTTYRLRKFARKNRVVLRTTAAIVLLLACGVLISSWLAVRAMRAEDSARQAEDRAAAERDNAVKAAAEAKAQRDAAEAAEKKAIDQKVRADDEAATAKAVNDFLQEDLLRQADTRKQSERGFAANPKLTVNEALNRASTGIEKRFPNRPLLEAAIRAVIGDAYRGIGAHRQGILHLERSRTLRAAKLGPDHPDTLTAMNSLAEGYLDAGDTKRAMPLLEETLRLRTIKLGPDHRDTLESITSLAFGLHETGQLDRALPLYEQAFNLAKAKLGTDDPDTLLYMNNLGYGYHDAGRLDLALPLRTSTLELTKAKLGNNHALTLTSMSNLAQSLQAAGKLDRALLLHQETLELRKTKLGPTHPHTLVSMHNLAEACIQANKLELALRWHDEALKLRKATLGPDHPHTILSMSGVAATLWRMKQLDRSIPLFEEILHLQKEHLGEEHPLTLQTKANLGVNLRDAGRLDQAIPFLEEAYRKGRNHALLQWVADALVSAYVDADRTGAAVTVLREELADTRRSVKLEPAQLGAILAATGSQLIQLKAFADAEPILRECLKLRETLAPESWSTFNARSLLGGSLFGQQKYAEAEPLLLQGYQGMKQRADQIRPESKHRLTEALERLVQFYDATGKKDEAAKLQKELEASKLADKKPEMKP